MLSSRCFSRRHSNLYSRLTGRGVGATAQQYPLQYLPLLHHLQQHMWHPHQCLLVQLQQRSAAWISATPSAPQAAAIAVKAAGAGYSLQQQQQQAPLLLSLSQSTGEVLLALALLWWQTLSSLLQCQH